MKFRFLGLLIILLTLSCTSSSLEHMMSKAEALVGIGEQRAALDIYYKVAKRCPEYEGCAKALLYIGEIESNLEGRSSDALAAYERVVELFPLKEAGRVAHQRRAMLFERMGDYINAGSEYAQLLQYFPNDERAPFYLLKLGESYLAMGNYGQARIELKGLVKAEGRYPDVRPEAIFAYAESFFLEGRLGLAEKVYRMLLEQYPDSDLVSEAKLKIATCQEERGFLGDASKTLANARTDYPNEAVIEKRLQSMKKRGKGKPPEDAERLKRRAEEAEKGEEDKKK